METGRLSHTQGLTNRSLTHWSSQTWSSNRFFFFLPFQISPHLCDLSEKSLSLPVTTSPADCVIGSQVFYLSPVKISCESGIERIMWTDEE